jgi:hypothetical protein
MSTTTEELSTHVKTAGAGAGEVHAHAETLLEAARNKYETAAAHGWGGVASTMEQAVEHLEGVVGQLQSTEQSCETAGTVLDGIDAKMSSPEVAEHLVTALGALDEAQSAGQGAIGLIDDAIQACEAAGLESLPGSLNTLRENTEQLHEQLSHLHTDIDAERQAAENYTDQDQDEAPGN